MTSQRSSASVSDSSGNLLFYTDGINVWNNAHQIMPNATGLFGNNEIDQSVIIVPDPNNTSKYYVFTNRGNAMGLSGIYYSIIDMSLDGGLGDVDVAQKNIILQGVGDYSKNLTVILNSNDNSYWIVIFGSKDGIASDTFYTYKVDALGVNLANQVTFTFNLNESTENVTGQMKISPDGQSLALIHNTVGAGRNGEFEEAQSLFVFDFDSVTGAISQLNDSFSLNDISIKSMLESNYAIEIYDHKGSLVNKKKVTKKDFNINTSSFKSGIYYLKIIDSNSNIIHKSIIKI